MYTPEQLRQMSGGEFAALLKTMSRRDLEGLLVWLNGHSPAVMARALEYIEDPGEFVSRLLGETASVAS